MQNISEKIPSIALAVLMVITLILCGLFYAGGTESVECTSGSFDAPTHTDSMINWIYILIIVTGIATLGLAGLSFIIKIKKDPKSVIVPTVAMIFLVLMLCITYFGADTTPMSIVGYEGSQEPWVYRITNMCMVTSAILATIATIVTLFGFLLKRFN